MNNAFYLTLARGEKPADEELLAEAWRLGIVRRKFMLKFDLTNKPTKDHKIGDRCVPEALGWLGICMVDGRFPALKLKKETEKFEEWTEDQRAKYADVMFENDLQRWWNEDEKGIDRLAHRKDKEGNIIINYYPEPDEEGNVAPDYRPPETELARIADRAETKEGAFAKYCQDLKDDPSNENKAKSLMIKQELKRRAELGREGPEVLERDLAEALEGLVTPLEYCGRNCTLLGASPVNKTQTLAWAGHHQHPRRRKTSN